MNWRTEQDGQSAQRSPWGELDPAMKQALGDFKANVDAWSNAARLRPQQGRIVMERHGWRPVSAWAAAALLLAGGVSSGLYAHHRTAVAAQEALALQHAQAEQRLVAAERARQEENLLLHVDSDVSRQVPQAFEPLAQLMPDDTTEQ